MQDVFQIADSLGPEKIIHIHDPAVALKAIVVIDNTAAGPAIGGTRVAPDVSLEECIRLARAMTFKNAAAGLPHGGAKSVIFANPAMSLNEKERTLRAFASAIRDVVDYIPGPDMGTDEVAMAWVRDEIGRSVGLPRVVGGIPLDEIGATGFGLAAAAEVAQEFGGPKLEGARVAVQGFGAVGQHAARFLAAKGARLIAASDTQGTIVDRDGFDVAELVNLKRSGAALSSHGKGQKLDRDDIIRIPCDIWIPAARPDILHADNVAQLDTRLVLQGANIPATPEAEESLHRRGIHSIPDFIANAGGVICASVEYHGGSEAQSLATISEKISRNTREVLRDVREHGILPRVAATRLAERRVREAMSYRRWKR
jgi:glutamate dehydrogenase/leucine dehydrogenase